MLPGFVKPVVVVVLLVEVLLVVAGAAGGAHVEEGSVSHLFNMVVSAPSSLGVTVSSQRVLMVAHEWA